jgi:hypothetical protein
VPRPPVTYRPPGKSVAPRVPETTPWSGRQTWPNTNPPPRAERATLRSPAMPPAAAAQPTQRPTDQPGRGVTAWLALAILLLVAGGAGVLDYARGLSSGGLFGYGLALGSLVAIIAVRRSSMFPVVIAPPIVYIGGKLVASMLRHQDLMSRRGMIDVGTNWFVYGFPAMAAATAIVLLVAGVRLLINR